MKKEKKPNPFLLFFLQKAQKYVATGGIKRIHSISNIFRKPMWSLLKKRRAETIQRIQFHLQVPYEKAKDIAYISFQQNLQSFFEITYTHFFGFDNNKHLASEPAPEKASSFFADNTRPVVAVTAHIGAWELLAGLLGDITSKHSQIIVRSSSKAPVMNAWMTQQRSVKGVEVVGHRNVVFSVLRNLRKGGISAFLVDHNTQQEEAIFLPFLGKTAAVNRGPAILALQSKALVCPIFLIRQGNALYEVHLYDYLDTLELTGTKEEKITAIAAFYTNAVERAVKEFPEQWFWMHRRWKTQPEIEKKEL